MGDVEGFDLRRKNDVKKVWIKRFGTWLFM
jgi:hypothetical protein